MAEIGVLNEIGDMGLGWRPLEEKDQKAYAESMKQQQNDNDSSQVINEKNK